MPQATSGDTGAAVSDTDRPARPNAAGLLAALRPERAPRGFAADEFPGRTKGSQAVAAPAPAPAVAELTHARADVGETAPEVSGSADVDAANVRIARQESGGPGTGGGP